MNKHVPLAEKLTALQEADAFRKWYCLDDKRVCVLCDRVISGRMIDVWQESNGSYRLHCPTRGCPATPRDWFYHGPVRSRIAARVVRELAPISGLGSCLPNE
jgi:hypothetical protein